MFSDEPGLQFVGSNHAADQEIVGPVVSVLGDFAAGFLELARLEDDLRPLARAEAARGADEAALE